MNLFGWRLATLVNGLKDATAYRVEFLLDVFGQAIIPAAIQWVIWYALFIINKQETIGGMTYAMMVQYTFMSMLFSQIRGGDQDFELSEMIRSGSLSQYLLRPVGVVEFFYLRGIAPKILISVLSLVIGFILSYFWETSAYRMIGAMVLAMIGNIIHYQIGAILATVAFYWEEAYSVLMVKNLFVSLLSGELLPLFLFPESLSWLWKSTPFYLYVFGPVQYANGQWTDAQFVSSIITGLLWIGVCSVGVAVSWRVGVRKYVALGG